MYSISELKKEMLIELDGSPYKVVFTQHNFVGRGGATLRTRLKNLLTGAVLEKTFRPADKISPANISNRAAQYLYTHGQEAVFMNSQTYEQHHLPSNLIADKAAYIKEGQEVNLIYSGSKAIDVVLPNSVQLRVTQSEPGVKGDTATAAQKSCTLETGAKVNVPLFIKVGDVLKIDTRTGQYLERVK